MPTDPANAAVNAGSQGQSTGRIVLSATLTLTLSILGSSVLPVPFAVSRTGVLLGLLTMLVVSYSNALTSILLLKASGHTGHQTYEGVAEAAGGPLLKVPLNFALQPVWNAGHRLLSPQFGNTAPNYADGKGHACQAYHTPTAPAGRNEDQLDLTIIWHYYW